MNPPAVQRLLGQLKGSPGAPLAAIEDVERETGMQIPGEYRQILQKHNGGDVRIGGTELTLWSVGYIGQVYSEYELETYLKGALLFASDQNADAFGYDLRAGASGGLIRVPMIGMSWDESSAMGESFGAFLEKLARP